MKQNFYTTIGRVLTVLLEEMLPTCRNVAICQVLTIMLLLLYLLSISCILGILLLSCVLLLHIMSHLACCPCMGILRLCRLIRRIW